MTVTLDFFRFLFKNRKKITHHKLDLEIEKINDYNTRKKVQDQIQEQVSIVDKHIQQAEQFAQQVPQPQQVANASIQAYQLAVNTRSKVFSKMES